MELQSKLKIAHIAPAVFNLAHLINYQQDSVVSKQLIKKDAGTVTLFAFDQGQELSEHTAPFDALVNVIEGEAEIFISKRGYVLKGGDMIILPANHPHALKALQKFKMLLVMIRS